MFNESVWRDGEHKTRVYLMERGYKILYTNYPCVGVELDIVSVFSIAQQKKALKIEMKKILENETSEENCKTIKKSYNKMMKSLKNILVITEVKARSSKEFGLGREALNKYKMAHVKRGAEFLLTKKEFKNMQVRFDVSSVDEGVVNYTENAF